LPIGWSIRSFIRPFLPNQTCTFQERCYRQYLIATSVVCWLLLVVLLGWRRLMMLLWRWLLVVLLLLLLLLLDVLWLALTAVVALGLLDLAATVLVVLVVALLMAGSAVALATGAASATAFALLRQQDPSDALMDGLQLGQVGGGNLDRVTCDWHHHNVLPRVQLVLVLHHLGALPVILDACSLQ